jgi:ferrous iron transport protein B
MWFLVTFPQGQKALEYSYAGQVGKLREPALKPLGFDWWIGIGLLSAQAEREVMVSSLATK